MRNENWSASKSRAHVSSRLPPNPALGYARPDIRTVAVEIEGDEDYFLPSCEAGSDFAFLFANLPSGDLEMVSGGAIVIDCGLSMKAPQGYRFRISSEVPGLFLELLDANRIKVHAFNAGSNLTLIHKQKIGKISIEPVYFIEWITKG